MTRACTRPRPRPRRARPGEVGAGEVPRLVSKGQHSGRGQCARRRARSLGAPRTPAGAGATRAQVRRAGDSSPRLPRRPRPPLAPRRAAPWRGAPGTAAPARPRAGARLRAPAGSPTITRARPPPLQVHGLRGPARRARRTGPSAPASPPPNSPRAFPTRAPPPEARPPALALDQAAPAPGRSPRHRDPPRSPPRGAASGAGAGDPRRAGQSGAWGREAPALTPGRLPHAAARGFPAVSPPPRLPAQAMGTGEERSRRDRAGDGASGAAGQGLETVLVSPGLGGPRRWGDAGRPAGAGARGRAAGQCRAAGGGADGFVLELGKLDRVPVFPPDSPRSRGLCTVTGPGTHFESRGPGAEAGERRGEGAVPRGRRPAPGPPRALLLPGAFPNEVREGEVPVVVQPRFHRVPLPRPRAAGARPLHGRAARRCASRGPASPRVRGPVPEPRTRPADPPPRPAQVRAAPASCSGAGPARSPAPPLRVPGSRCGGRGGYRSPRLPGVPPSPVPAASLVPDPEATAAATGELSGSAVAAA